MSTKAKPVALDLDALLVEHKEKRAKDAVEPFVLDGVGPDGLSVTFIDPKDLSWEQSQDIATAFKQDDLREVFFTLIEDSDQLDAWFEAQVPGEVAGEVLKRWMRHHGFDIVRGRLNRAERRAKN